MNCGEFEELLRRTGRTEAEQEALLRAGTPAGCVIRDREAEADRRRTGESDSESGEAA